MMNDILPNALMIGVDYDLFWKLNPKSLKPFFKAFNLRQEYDNAMAWRHGMYVRLAIGSSMSKNVKYPNTPMSMTGRDEETMIEDIKIKMINKMKVINSTFGKEGNDAE